MKSEGQRSGGSSGSDGTPDRPRKKTSTPKPSPKIGSFYPTLNDVSLMAISSSDDEENEITEFLQSHSTDGAVHLNIPVQEVAAVRIEGSDSSVQSPAVEKSATKRKRKTPSKQPSSKIEQGMSPLKREALQQASSSQDSGSPRRKSSSKKKIAAVDDKVMMPSEISETVTLSSSCDDNENNENKELRKSDSFTHKIQGSAQKLAAEFHRDSSDSSFKSPSMAKSAAKKKRKMSAKVPSGVIDQEMSPQIMGTIPQASGSQISGSPRKKPSSKRKSAIVGDHVTQPSSFSLSSSCDDDEKHRSKERHKRPSSKHKIRSDVPVQNLTSEIHMESSDASLKSPAVGKSAAKKKRKTPSKQPPAAIEQGMSPLSTLNRGSDSQKSPSKKNKSTIDVVLPSEILESVLSSSDNDENNQNKEPRESHSSKSKIHSNASVQKLATEFRKESSNTSIKSPAVEKSATKKKRKTPSKQPPGAIEQGMSPLSTLNRDRSSQSSSPRKKSPSKKNKSTVDMVLSSEISESVISSSDDDENIKNEELGKSHLSKGKVLSNASVQKLASEFHSESSDPSLKSPAVEKSVTKRKRKTPAKSASGAIKPEMSLLTLGTVQHANSSQESGSPKKKSSKKNTSTVDVVLPSEISECVLSSSDDDGDIQNEGPDKSHSSKRKIHPNKSVQKLEFHRESSDASLQSSAVEKSVTKRKRKTPAKSASGASKREMSPLNLGTLQHESNSQKSGSPKKRSSKKNTSITDVVLSSEISESVLSSSDDSENNLNGEPHNGLSSKVKIHSNSSVHMECSESLKSPTVEKSATKRRRKTPAKSASGAIKLEMSPLKLGSLHQASRSENSISPGKTSPSKKKAAMSDDHVARPSDISEAHGQMPSQHPVKVERGTDRIDTPCHQVDAGITSDDSSASDSSSLADSSSEDEAAVTAAVVQSVSEQTTTEDRQEEESRGGGGETNKQMR